MSTRLIPALMVLALAVWAGEPNPFAPPASTNASKPRIFTPVAPAQGQTAADEAALKEKVSPKMLEWFRAGLPQDAMGLAIVEGQVVSLRTMRFCPEGGPGCGLGPTCDHVGKRLFTTAKFKVNAPLIRRQRPFIPPTIEDYPNPPGLADLRAGDMVLIAFHTLSTNQQPRIGLVEKVRPATNAPPAAPKP